MVISKGTSIRIYRAYSFGRGPVRYDVKQENKQHIPEEFILPDEFQAPFPEKQDNHDRPGKKMVDAFKRIGEQMEQCFPYPKTDDSPAGHFTGQYFEYLAGFNGISRKI